MTAKMTSAVWRETMPCVHPLQSRAAVQAGLKMANMCEFS